MDDLYQQNILEHFKHPHHRGALSAYDMKEEGSNPSCGDELTLYIALENDVVRDVGFEGEGCAISTASMSLLSDHMIGKRKGDLLRMTDLDIYQLLGIPIGPQREKCALLSLWTLQKALQKGSV